MINSNLILLEYPATCKEDAIKGLITKAQEAGLVSDYDAFYAAVQHREGLANTYMGDGFAIPHGKSDAVSEPFMGMAQLRSPIPWNNDEEQTELVFIIGVPTENTGNIHLKMIGALCRRLVDEELVQSLKRTGQTVEELSILLK